MFEHVRTFAPAPRSVMLRKLLENVPIIGGKHFAKANPNVERLLVVAVETSKFCTGFLNKYPHDSEAVLQLIFRDQKFRNICEDYCEVQAVIEAHRHMTTAEARARLQEYIEMSDSLLREADMYFRDAGRRGSIGGGTSNVQSARHAE